MDRDILPTRAWSGQGHIEWGLISCLVLMIRGGFGDVSLEWLADLLVEDWGSSDDGGSGHS